MLQLYGQLENGGWKTELEQGTGNYPKRKLQGENAVTRRFELVKILFTDITRDDLGPSCSQLRSTIN